MSVRTPRRSVQLLVDDLQRAASCVAQAVLRSELALPRALISFGGTPPRVRVGRRRGRWIELNLAVEAREDDQETGSWRTHTLRYDFSLYNQPEGGEALIAYHFHPDPEHRGFQRPHLHVGARPAWTPRTLARTHLPTGRVTCEAFVRMLIEEFEIGARRDDWDRILASNEKKFEERRTW